MSHLFIIFGFIFFFINCNAIVIKTKLGSLKGLVLESRNGTKYNAFLGIPFAKPPVGELRFEPPQPPDSWTGVRDATKPGSICIQDMPGLSEFFDTDKGQEDCLYANVYTPSKPRTLSKIPVMVWIHGGAFVIGFGDMYDPDYFLDHDIVFVSFNYRLGALGFLSAADEILPGNYGLKDQIAALKWVQEYIADFGGDPQRVTIAGLSAGGASVHLLMHSPLSKGLFCAAISHSGSALAHWAQISPSAARQKLNAFAVLAGCSTESTRVLVDCLKNISAEEMLAIQLKFHVWDMTPINVFPPVKEPANVKDAFLREDPWKQKVQMDVPFIVAFTSAEGAGFVWKLLSDEGKLANVLDVDYKRLFPVIFSYQHWLKNKDVVKITESLRHFYFPGKKIGLETAQDLVKLWSDGFFNYDLMEAIYRHTNEVYVFYYDRIGSQRFNVLWNCSIELGVSHGEDTLCLFPFTKVLGPHNLSSTDIEVSERFVNYWINFAYTGNPTLDNSWLPSKSEEELTYLHVQNDGNYMKTGLLQDRYAFWQNLGVHPSHTETKNAFLSDEL